MLTQSAFKHWRKCPTEEAAQLCKIKDDMHEIGEELVCAITLSLPVDPVTACDGHIYERSAVEEWLNRGNYRSPRTNEQMGSTLRPAPHVKNVIEKLIMSGVLADGVVESWQKRLQEDKELQQTRGKLAVSEKVPVEMAPSPAGAVVAMDLGFTRFDGFRVEGFGGAGGTNGDQSRSAAERERERVDP